MLQDMSESRRLNTNINKTIQAKAPTGIMLLRRAAPPPGVLLTHCDHTTTQRRARPCSILRSFLRCSGLRYVKMSLLFPRPYKGSHFCQWATYLQPAQRVLTSDYHHSSMESYEKEYQAVKASRKLCWRPALGTVEVELEGPNGAQSFSVSPLQAAIIYLFQDQGTPLSAKKLPAVDGSQADAQQKSGQSRSWQRSSAPPARWCARVRATGWLTEL